MDPMENFGVGKTIILDTKRYGYWKVRTMQLIRGQGEDAWTAVEDGWEAPTREDTDGKKVLKPKSEWTADEKMLSKYNARAMSVIFGSVDEDEFKLIQGCKSAKQAWDTLQRSHEGTSRVKQTRLDQLAARFENLKMQSDETIVQFSSKISAIANEAEVLGKTYKEKKLVKKLLRCLPPKFAAHKAVMRVSGDTDTLKYDELVGILKSEEMEVDDEAAASSKGKGIAFQAAEEKRDEIQELKDNMSLLAKNFSKAFKRNEKRDKTGDKESPHWNRSYEGARSRSLTQDTDKHAVKREVKCYDCGGLGHFQNDCPTGKRRCFECKGIGHTKFECPNKNWKKEKSLLAQSDSESDDDSGEGMMNMVAFVSRDSSYGSVSSAVPESDDDEPGNIVEFSALYDRWMELNREKLDWVREKNRLEAQVRFLEDEVTNNIVANVDLAPLEENMELRKLYSEERENAKCLQRDLDEMQKKVRMLNMGTQRLDEILSVGRTEKSHRGLGYNRFAPSSSKSADYSVKFVQKGTMEDELCGFKKSSPDPQRKLVSGKPIMTREFSVRYNTVGTKDRLPTGRRSLWVCGFCNGKGHIRSMCNSFKRHVKLLWNLKKCYLEPTQFMCVWVAKKDLYCKEDMWRELLEIDRQFDTQLESVHTVERRPLYNWVARVAYTAQGDDRSGNWYFDSGCSRHMTGCLTVLDNYTPSEQGKVTFGGGHRGKIKGKGDLDGKDLPQLMEVYFVEGLKANLISVSQLCDTGLQVTFTKTECWAKNGDGGTVLSGIRSDNNCYMWEKKEICLSATNSQLDLWHKRLGHMNTQTLVRLVQSETVKGIPMLKGSSDTVCRACSQGKQIRVQHKRSSEITTSKILELVHMDLMGPVQVESLNGKRYVFVLVDDFSRYTWVRFLRDKSDAVCEFRVLALLLKNTKGAIGCIRSDRGGEFVNEGFSVFCGSQGIEHQFSAPRTPQQNGIVERKNRTLQEMARAMMFEKDIPTRFWAEAVNTACYIINRVYVRPGMSVTPYELWKGKPPSLYYFHIFGCVCYILNDKDYLGKFDSRSDEGVFLGYSWNSRAFRVYNKRSKRVEESVNVIFDDNSSVKRQTVSEGRDEDVSQEGPPSLSDNEEGEMSDHEGEREETRPQVHRNHSNSDLIGGLHDKRTTRGKKINFREMIQFASFVSLIEPSNINDALKDEFWTVACQEELNQFSRNDVWDLVEKPTNANVVGTKWIFKNKIDDAGNVTRNKARLVAQGYSQMEGIDFDETFAPVARIESIRLLMGVACVLNIRLFQMDVKSAFLNGILQEEVYVAQPKGFEDPIHPTHVYKLKKALYGLKQAPRAWYERLTDFLQKDGFTRGSVDKTLFVKHSGENILIVQIYVDDIVFGSTCMSLVNRLVKTMTSEFEMSMMGELNYFLGLQIKQSDEGITVSQSTYAKNMIKRFGLHASKTSKTPMSTTNKLCKDEEGQSVDQKLYRSMIGSLLYLTATRPDLCFSVGVCARYQASPKLSHLNAVKRIIKYVKGTIDFGLSFTKQSNCSLVGFCDADWAGSMDDRRSTSGGCFFLGNNLVSWHSKKQNCVTLSTAEAEYIALGSCCTQLLWMHQMLSDFGMSSTSLLVYCDNMSAINISKNPVQHSRTKHIDIRHHFIRELVEDKKVVISHVTSENQLADIFTKPLDLNSFTNLQKSLGICTN